MSVNGGHSIWFDRKRCKRHGVLACDILVPVEDVDERWVGSVPRSKNDNVDIRDDGSVV